MAREYAFDQLYGPAAGPEIDGTPLQIPSGFRRPLTLEEQVQRLVRGALSRQAAEAGMETFEEANDFDVPDDPVDPSTPFEEYFDPVLGRSITPDEFRRFESAYREEYLRGQADKITAEDRAEALRAHVEALKAAKNQKNRPEGGGSPPPLPPLPAINPRPPERSNFRGCEGRASLLARPLS